MEKGQTGADRINERSGADGARGGEFRFEKTRKDEACRCNRKPGPVRFALIETQNARDEPADPLEQMRACEQQGAGNHREAQRAFGEGKLLDVLAHEETYNAERMRRA
jgi:hypothetical protein